MEISSYRAIKWFLTDPKYFEYYYQLRVKELRGWNSYICPNCGSQIEKDSGVAGSVTKEGLPICKRCSSIKHENWCKYPGVVGSVCPLCDKKAGKVYSLLGKDFFDSLKAKEEAKLTIDSTIIYDAVWEMAPGPFMASILVFGFMLITWFALKSFDHVPFIQAVIYHKFDILEFSIPFPYYFEFILPILTWALIRRHILRRANKAYDEIKEFRNTEEVMKV